MANLRPVLLVTLVFLGYMLWVEWQKDYGPDAVTEPAPSAAGRGETPSEQDAMTVPSGGADLPNVADAPSSGDLPSRPGTDAAATETRETVASRRVRVSTDVLELEIDTVGGTVTSARLLDYPVDLDAPDTKVRLLSTDLSGFQVAQSGLLSRQDAPNHTTTFQVSAETFRLDDGEDVLRVPLTWKGEDGLEVTQAFVLRRGRYDIEVEHRVSNRGTGAWTGSRYEQLQRVLPGDDEGSGFNNPERYSFLGIGIYTPEEKLEKIDLEDVADEPFQRTAAGGWLAMIQHHFLSAWIPDAGEVTSYSTQSFSPGGPPRAIARGVSQPVTLAPGEEHVFSSTLFVGPKLQDQLADIAPGLDLTVNYGIFTVFSAPLFWLMEKIYGFVGNWGWAIVILTVLIKLAFFKLTEAQYRSMARMRKLQPRIEKLKERYGEDRQAMSQAMMQMYKEEKVNPLGGCLPILVQIPIFIALYWVLLESVELRQAPFILWIDNLSVRDPYFILPALNAVFMFATQKLTPMAGMDPIQKKMMQAMPIVFSIMFAFFPAGLVLYWATNAGLSLAQQWYITRKIAAE
jgi:YidC/Oxa1 family membrane protein insertase